MKNHIPVRDKDLLKAAQAVFGDIVTDAYRLDPNELTGMRGFPFDDRRIVLCFSNGHKVELNASHWGAAYRHLDPDDTVFPLPPQTKSISSGVFKNGMTVKDLKVFIKDWPEEDWHGDPTEVWIETGKNLSSPIIFATKLNSRTDKETGKEWADILFESGQYR